MSRGQRVWVTGRPMFGKACNGWIDSSGIIEAVDDYGNALIRVLVTPFNRPEGSSENLIWFGRKAFVLV